MEYNKDIIDFWKNDDFVNITPRGKEFPEGWDVRELLSDIIHDDVIEVGCGYGRLVEAFETCKYTGVDINPKGVAEAQKHNPMYNFENFNIGDELKESTWLMFYTVLLHVNDEDIQAYLESVTKNTEKVLVAEILGRSWRGGFKYAFNREEEEYDKLFENCGFKKSGSIVRDYLHYPGAGITFIVYEKK